MVPSVCQIQSQINGLRYGVVMLREVSGVARFYVAAEDTNAARYAALASAVESVYTGDVITLLQGVFTIPSGVSITDNTAATGWMLAFWPGSAVDYTDWRDAEDDADIYGTHRHVNDFNADPTGAVDSWSAFMAAKHSLPAHPSARDEDTEFDALGERIRQGRVLRSAGTYLMSAPFTQQAGQRWDIDEGGGRSLVYFMAGIAPAAGAVKNAWGVARTMVDLGGGPTPLANWTHDLGIESVVFDVDPTDNENLRMMLWGAAQNSYVRDITSGASWSAGILLHPFTANCDFSGMHLFGTGRVGPAFECYFCNDNTFRNITIVGFNAAGTYNDVGTAYLPGEKYMPGFRMEIARNNHIINLQVENSPAGVLLNQARGNVFSILTCSTTAGLADTVALEFEVNSDNNVVSTLRGDDFDTLIMDDGVVVRAGAVGEARTNYAQDVRYFEEVNATTGVTLPTASAVIEFARPGGAVPATAQLFRIKTGQADANPALVICSSAADGSTNLFEHINFATQNGGASAGYNVSVPNLFSTGTVRSQGDVRAETGYYFGATQVVGDRNTGWGAMTGTATKSAIAAYTAPVISGAYVQAEVQALADALQAATRRLKAYDDALIAHGLIGT